MNKKFLLQKFGIVLLILGIFSFAPAIGQTLKHSYTFEEGTADVVAGVDGVLEGSAVVEDGALVTSGGFMSLSGKDINVPGYTSITFEAYYEQADGLSGFTSLFAFGQTVPGGVIGANYIIYQPTRGDDVSRLALCTGNTTDPWTSETGVNGDQIEDTKKHHVVTVLTQTDITYFLDGVMIGTTPYSGDNALASVSSDTAYIAGGVYVNDPKWEGSLYEFNIYDGTMDEAQAMERYLNYVGPDYLNANLAALSITPGDIDIPFDPAEVFYEFQVPYGTTEVTIEVETESDVSTYEIYNSEGELIGDDGLVVLDENGEEEVEITVTALSTDTKTYIATIFPYEESTSEKLSEIQITGGELLGEFNPDTTTYSVRADYGVTSIEVNAIAMGASATVTGDGTIDLTDGEATAVITVLSGDKSATRDYTLNIFTTHVQPNTSYYLQHETSGYVLAENDDTYTRVKEAWIDDANQIFQFVPGDIAGQYFIQNQNGNYLRLAESTTYIDGDGNEQTQVWDMIFSPDKHTYIDSCLFELDEFEQGRFRIISVARAASFENVFMGTNNNNMNGGVFSDKWADNQYAVWYINAPADMELTYNNFLTSLSCDQAAFKPGFSMTTMEYYLTIPKDASSIDINAVAEDANTTITGAGNIAITDARGDIVITVTSTIDASHSKEYVIHYVKDTELTLMHSYTFADGTVRDVVGNADGVAEGGYVENGVFISGGYFDEGGAFVSNEDREEEGFITLPADSIDIATYPSITIEAYVTAGVNDNWSMLSYYGGLNGSQSFWMSVQNRNDYTRSVINQGEEVQSQTVPEAEPGTTYHYVTTLTKDSIALFINGQGVPKAALPDDYMIKNISTENAWILKGGYPDPTWIGSVYEYNIYSGEMDDIKILERSGALPTEDNTTDATLSTLRLDGDTIEGFHPANLNYTVQLEEGSTVPVIDGVVKVDGAEITTITSPDAIPGVATVLVTASDNSTTVTYTIEFEVATGIGKGDVVSESNIKVYPTVSTGEFTVEMEGQSSLITVYDLAGRLVKQVKSNSQREIISIDQKGMYIVKVESDGDTKLFKVFKR